MTIANCKLQIARSKPDDESANRRGNGSTILKGNTPTIRKASSSGLRYRLPSASLLILHFAFFTGHWTFSTSAAAQPQPETPRRPGVYQPVGAPADPKVAVRWNRFNTYEETANILKRLAAAHPDRCKLVSLGKSHGDHEMWLLALTNFKTGEDTAKTAFWIDGGIHANELQAVEVPLYTAWYLLEMYGRSEFITRLLDERTFYILPMLSPDSRDAHMTKPNTTHSPRTGQRPVDDDRDGLIDEDGPDDLDGDGHITQMRVKDPNGSFKPHEEFPEYLVRVKPGERGAYTLLGAEGIDNDGDGKVNEDSDGSYDPNRDWAWNWQPPHVQNGAHRYPFSILENRMAAEFVMKHPNIAGAQSYHNTGGMILRGPGAKEDQYEPADISVYDQIGRKGEMMLPGYRYLVIGPQLYEVYGGLVDWMHGMQGVYCYTNELFTPFNYFRTPTTDIMGGSEERHRFNKYLLFDEGFVKWREVDHPTYGKIEVGGFKKSWTRQPPSFLLEEECHRNMAFTLYHADQMPLVKVQSVESKPLGGGLTEVTAAIENTRITPTHSAADVKNKITPADVVAISGKDVTVVLGMKSTDRFFQSFEEQKRSPEAMKLRNVPGNDVVYVRWIVRGAGPYTVKIVSVKGGKDEKSGG